LACFACSAVLKIQQLIFFQSVLLVQIQPPQPILLIHKGFSDFIGKPLFRLGKTWERNYFRLDFLGPSYTEQFAQLLCWILLISRERMRVGLRHTVPAMTKAQLAELLRDTEGIHRCRARRAKRMQSE
jgi:hypothetical protein